MKKYPHLYLAFMLLLITGILSSCGGDASSDEQPATTEDTSVGSTGDSTDNGDTTEPAALPDPADMVSGDIKLDPATASLDDEDSLMVSSFIYEGLVGMDSNGQIVASLAESWTISEDQLDYIFILRPDATFHDGTAVTADTVMANFNRWFDPENALHGDGTYEAWQTYFLGFKGELNPDETPVSSFDGIEKVDDRTVLIHLHRIMPEFLDYLSKPSFSILNPDTLASAGDAYGTSADTVSGTGPYMVSEWSDANLVLEPYAGYWGTAKESNIEFGLE